VHMEIRTILREILRQTDWDQSELATRLKVSQPTISRWMDDKKPQEPKIKQRDRIVALAEKHGIVNGHNKGAYRTISIVGYVGAGGQVAYGEGQGPFGEAPMPPKDATARTVAVVIRGDSMAPLADGWTVYYDDRRDPPTEDLFGKLCVAISMHTTPLNIHNAPASRSTVQQSQPIWPPPNTPAAIICNQPSLPKWHSRRATPRLSKAATSQSCWAT
jgi:hypothetical protein